MLGLKKMDAHWLVRKQCFETVIVGGKMRVVLEALSMSMPEMARRPDPFPCIPATQH